MFKKKVKPNEQSGLDIGLHPIEVPEETKGSSRKLKMAIVLGVVILSAIIVTVVMSSGKEKQAPPKSPDTLVTPDKGGKQLVLPTETTPATTAPDDGKPVASVPVEKKLVTYENVILGLKLDYPPAWFVIEKTNESLPLLNKVIVPDKKFSAKDTELPIVVPVADFYPSDKAETRITFVTASATTGLKGAEKGVLHPAIKKNYKLEKADAEQTKDIDGESVKTIAYVIDDAGTKIEGLQMVIPYGKNIVILNGTSLVGKKSDKLTVMEEMVKSVIASGKPQKSTAVTPVGGTTTVNGAVPTIDPDPLVGLPPVGSPDPNSSAVKEGNKK
jgi:hypothetical protein